MPNLLTDSALSVGAYATSADVFANEPGRVLERPSIVEFLPVASAAGMRVTFMVGSRVLIQDQVVNPSNRWPIDPDDVALRTAGTRGEQIQCKYRNTTAGALTVNTIVKITPLQ